MNISAESVSNAAATLETAANAGAARQVLALKNALINATDALLQNINAWLRSYDEKVTKPVRNSPDPAVLKRLKQGCENYDIAAIDEAMNALENTEYETGNDLIAWLREKIGVSEFEEVARRLGG
jgi:hypothetical protein